VVEVFSCPGVGPLSHGNEPVLAAFALPDAQDLALMIEVSAIEIDQFHPADTGGVEGFKDGPIPEPERIAQIREGQ